MSQYKIGTVNVTNGSATVIGVGTAWLANLSIGDSLVAQDPALTPNQIIAYEVAGVVSDLELTLSVVYGGPTETGLSSVTHRDFHPNGAPKWANGDVEFAAIHYESNTIFDIGVVPIVSSK